MNKDKVEAQEIVKVLDMLLEKNLITSEEHRKAKIIVYTE